MNPVTVFRQEWGQPVQMTDLVRRAGTGSNRGVSTAAPSPAPSAYRLAPPVVVRLMGAAMVLAGLLLVVLTILVATLDLPAAVLSVGVVAAVATVVGLGWLLRRRAAVVRLDPAGYQVRWVRGAGVTRGRWKDVEDVLATTVEGERCVVLRRRDGTSTTIPVGILAGSPDDFVRDLQQHLNRGHGYRPLR